MFDERVGVVIPARNGAGTIDRSLGSLALQAFDGTVEAVVVCNGCTDDTAAHAERWRAAMAVRNWRLLVTESEPGRVNALNAGEACLSDYDMLVMLDHDVRLSANALSALLAAIRSGAGFAAPRLELEPGSTPMVDAYYRGWSALPYVRQSPVTIGVYALSPAGRKRWGRFPAGVPDDKLARLSFTRAERRLVDEATYGVVNPRDLPALLRARRRYDKSNVVLLEHFPGLAPVARSERAAGLVTWGLQRTNWRSAALVLAVHAASRVAVR